MPQQQEIGGATSSREDRRAWLLVAVGCRVEQRNEAAPQLGGHNAGRKLGGHDSGRVGSQLWDRRVAAASSEVNAWPWVRQAPALGAGWREGSLEGGVSDGVCGGSMKEMGAVARGVTGGRGKIRTNRFFPLNGGIGG